MKSLLCILLTVFSACPVSGNSQPQTDAVMSFVSRISGGCVSFRYSFVIKTLSSSGKVTGEGSVLMQGASYHLQGNGMEVWCDGNSVWTADLSSKEVVIEPATEDVLVNPALILSDLPRHFSWQSAYREGTFSSQPSRVFLLKPLSKSDMQSLELFFDSRGMELLGGRMLLKDNVSATFFISGLAVRETVTKFVPESFPSEWIVTDLR